MLVRATNLGGYDVVPPVQAVQQPALLARLVPIDLSPAVFKQGHSARSLLQHIHISITRVSKDGFLILAPRSMAGTLIKDLKSAMQTVAAREML